MEPLGAAADVPSTTCNMAYKVQQAQQQHAIRSKTASWSHSLTRAISKCTKAQLMNCAHSATNHRRAAAAACASAVQDPNCVAGVFQQFVCVRCHATVTDWDRSRAAARLRPAVRADRGALPRAVHHDAGKANRSCRTNRLHSSARLWLRPD